MHKKQITNFNNILCYNRSKFYSYKENNGKQPNQEAYPKSIGHNNRERKVARFTIKTLNDKKENFHYNKDSRYS